MILSTTPQIEGHPIREYKGVVTGETIIGANAFKDFFRHSRHRPRLRDHRRQRLNAHGSRQRHRSSNLIKLSLRRAFTAGLRDSNLKNKLWTEF